jgi:hypothetical protein
MPRRQVPPASTDLSIGVFVYRPMDAVFLLQPDAAAGTTAAIVGPAEAEAGGVAGEGPTASRIPDGVVDAPSDCGTGFHRLGYPGLSAPPAPSSMRSHRLCGPIDLLWDGGPIHRRLIVREFVAANSRLRVHLFPAYAPELNPAGFVWTQADHELANGAADDLAELRQHLDAAIRRLSQSQLLLRSCIHTSGLPWQG